HGPRQIQHEHDVHTRRFGLDVIIRQPRPGDCSDAERDCQQAEEKQKTPRSSVDFCTSRPRDVRAGELQGRQLAGLAAQQRVNRQQAEQRQQPRILEFKFAVHLTSEVCWCETADGLLDSAPARGDDRPAKTRRLSAKSTNSEARVAALRGGKKFGVPSSGGSGRVNAGLRTAGENFHSSHSRRKLEIICANSAPISLLPASAMENSVVVNSTAGSSNAAIT